MNTGSHHFTATRCAVTYYAQQDIDAEEVRRKIEDGEIAIGRPAGDVYVDRDGRYWVREQVAA